MKPDEEEMVDREIALHLSVIDQITMQKAASNVAIAKAMQMNGGELPAAEAREIVSLRGDIIDTPRAEMRRELLAEVERTLAEREHAEVNA